MFGDHGGNSCVCFSGKIEMNRNAAENHNRKNNLEMQWKAILEADSRCQLSEEQEEEVKAMTEKLPFVSVKKKNWLDVLKENTHSFIKNIL